MDRDPLSVRVRNKFVNSTSASSVSAMTRARRWAIFEGFFPDISDYRILDLGGTVHTWTSAPVRPKQVVIVNLSADRAIDVPDWITTQIGDACAPPAHIRDDRFDLVFSNSVLEHVGGYSNRMALAKNARELAPRHWVQTPYRYFPIEPHWLFPFFQFLPVSARASIAREWKVGHRRSPAHPSDAAVSNVLGVELLSITEMRHYFPDSQIVLERFAALAKSMLAVGTTDRPIDR